MGRIFTKLMYDERGTTAIEYGLMPRSSPS
jgi:Flp pilus assembly pilin Flp